MLLKKYFNRRYMYFLTIIIFKQFLKNFKYFNILKINLKQLKTKLLYKIFKACKKTIHPFKIYQNIIVLNSYKVDQLVLSNK